MWHICHRKLNKQIVIIKVALKFKTSFTRESRPRCNQNFLQLFGSKWQVGGPALAMSGHCDYFKRMEPLIIFFLSRVESVPPLHGPVFEAVGVTPRLWRSKSSTHKVM